MFSDRQLTNFQHYLSVTPKALWGKPPRDPEGAYDSRTGSHGLSMRHFARGGAFDAVGEAEGVNIPRALKFLASKLSREDWAELQSVLCGEEGGGATDDPPEFKGIPRTGAGAMDARPPRITTQSARDYAERFPGASRIGRA